MFRLKTQNSQLKTQGLRSRILKLRDIKGAALG